MAKKLMTRRKTKDKKYRVLFTKQTNPKNNGIKYVSGNTVIDGKRMDGKNIGNYGSQGIGNAVHPDCKDSISIDGNAVSPKYTYADIQNRLAYYRSLDGIENLDELQMDYGDGINHPAHYCESKAKCREGHPIECIDITRHLNFNIGNAIKYLWRCDHKGAALDDLKKAAWYINDEIKRREVK